MSRPVTLEGLEALLVAALQQSGASDHQALPTAKALTLAEADGIPSHGAARGPAYAGQIRAGRVDGAAKPEVRRLRSALMMVDVAGGFSPPALHQGLEAALEWLPETGSMTLLFENAHHFGVAGHPVERAAENGMVALAFANTPAAVAPWGGQKALFGTNPIAFACPRANGRPPLVIDSSTTVAARGKVVLAQKTGTALREGWALGPDGQPTTDPDQGAAGTMMPIGGAKGAAFGLMIEILCAALIGAQFGYEGGSFFEANGKQPRVGHVLFLIDPAAIPGSAFTERVEEMVAAILAQDGTRLPGDRRLQNRRHALTEGVTLPDPLFDQLKELANT